MLLTGVGAPKPEAVAVRELCGVQEDAKERPMRGGDRPARVLLPRGHCSGPGEIWSQGHERWLQGIRPDHAAQQRVRCFQEPTTT